MKKISDALTPLIMVALLSMIVYDKFHTNMAPGGTHDASVVKLGKEYRVAMDGLGSIPFDTVSTGQFDDISEMTKAQRDAFDKALMSAYVPIANDLERRFGKAEDGHVSPAIVQSYFRDLSFGYKGGK